jgi:hypothetical protein
MEIAVGLVAGTVPVLVGFVCLWLLSLIDLNRSHAEHNRTATRLAERHFDLSKQSAVLAEKMMSMTAVSGDGSSIDVRDDTPGSSYL